MLNQLLLFKKVAGGFGRNKRINMRTIFTDSIYPYPKQYMTKRYPRQFCYRETHHPPPWKAFEDVLAKNMMRFFWTFWWWQVFWNPDKVLGPSHHWPDPSKWTDEELGIPPDEEGTYEDWLKSRGLENYTPEVPKNTSYWKVANVYERN